MKLLDRILALLLVFFVVFPYLQLIPLHSYNQPYALIVSLLYCGINIKKVKRLSRKNIILTLWSITALGIIIFLISCFPYGSAQEYKYLTTYISFTTITTASIIAYQRYSIVINKIFRIAAIIWISVGVIQSTFSSSFLTFLVGEFGDTSGNLGLTGRGVLGLAPEPTHYGFHMIFMGVILAINGQSKILIALCLSAVILLAKSSSSVMAIGLGFIFYYIFKNLNFYKIAITGSVILLIPTIANAILDFTSSLTNPPRIIMLVRLFLSDPTMFLVLDYSVNNRIGGSIATITSIVNDFLVPHGLSHAAWISYREVIFSRNPWLFALSEAGVPSGIGNVLYQCGLLAIPALVVIFKRIISTKVKGKLGWLKVSIFFIMLNQFTLATPIFCFLVGLVIVKDLVRRQRQDIAPSQALASI